MQGDMIKKNDPECCPVLINKNDTQDLGKCEDAAPDTIKKCEGGIPNIRFRGFADDWEQRKLGDITESYSGGTPTAGKKEYYDGNIPFIRSGEISSDKTELFISNEGLNSSSAKMVEKGDILYALYGATSGEVSISKLKGAINQAVLAIQPHQNYDSQFLMQWLRKSKYNIIGTYLQGGQGNLSGSIVKELIIDVPTYEEQKQIGEYFSNLDNLITFHQRKCDETKELKKYMLQKMFPKEGEKVPEIRFQGFTEEWEKRKLGDLCEITTGKLDANAMVQNGQFDFYTSGIDVYKIDKAAFEGPAITIAGNGASVGYMHLVDGKFNAYQRTYVLTGFLADRQFLNVAIGNELPAKIQEEVRGSGIPYIVLNMLTELNIPFPSHNEQKQIGEFFRNLDHLITLHQRKSDELKELKQYMLRNMFPQKR